MLLTHAHFDHILAAHEVLEATGAQYVVPEKDTWLLSRDNMVSSADWHAIMCRIRRIFWRMRHRGDVRRHDGNLYGNARSHARLVRYQDRRLLFTGDTLFRHECGRCVLRAAISLPCCAL